jgi:hypothetical protein
VFLVLSFGTVRQKKIALQIVAPVISQKGG